MFSVMKMKYNKYLTEEDENFNDPLRDYAKGVDCLDLDCSDSVEYDDVEDDGLEDWTDEEYDDTLDSEEFNEGWVWVDDEEEDDKSPFIQFYIQMISSKLLTIDQVPEQFKNNVSPPINKQGQLS